MTCMMYAEHVLRVRMDWSSLGALKEKKFGGIRIAFIKYAVPDILYTLVPVWFRRNPKLVDEVGFLISEGREHNKTRRLGRTCNDMETVMEEAFVNIDDDMEEVKDQENIVKIEVNNLINELINKINLGELGGNTL